MRPDDVAGSIAVLDDSIDGLRTSSRSGGGRKATAGGARVVTTPVIGWLDSWAIDAASCPIVVTRF